MVISMSDNCWKRARKQTYEKLHKHKTKEEVEVQIKKRRNPNEETVKEEKKDLYDQ